MASPDALSIILQDCAHVISVDELKGKLAAGRPLRVKYGADPSAPDLHLGHTVVLRKLRQLQDLGHQVQFLIGDFTGAIGDPTGRSSTRPPLTPEQIQANARTYQEQVFKILRPERTQVVFNGSWCNPMTFSEVIRLAARTTAARILERDDFQKRYREGRPIGLHELLYPLIQGYDSVVLQSDIEMCGTDQIFNCLIARDLQEADGQTPEVILAMPLLEGLDGSKKMSKSLGNYVGITDPPGEMYGKLMSIPDGLMEKYFALLTNLPLEARERLNQELASGTLHPREAKARLAKILVAQYHDEESAGAAAREFDRVFRDREMPEEMPTFSISPADVPNGRMRLSALLVKSRLVSSNSEAQRMIQQGAVEFNQERVSDPFMEVSLAEGTVLRMGKRKFVKIHFT